MMNWYILEALQRAHEAARMREVEQQRIRAALAAQQPDRLARVLVWLGDQLVGLGRFLQARGGARSVEDTVRTSV